MTAHETLARIARDVLRERYVNITDVQVAEIADQADAVAAAIITDLELTEEYGVQISYEGRVISNNPLDREMAEAVVRRNVTENAHVATRWVSEWAREEPA